MSKTMSAKSWWHVAFAILIFSTTLNASAALTVPAESILVVVAAGLLTLGTLQSQDFRAPSVNSSASRWVMNSVVLAMIAVVVALPFADVFLSSLLSSASFLLFGSFLLGLASRRWKSGFRIDDLQVATTSIGLILTVGLLAHIAGASFTTSGYELSAQLNTSKRYQGLLNNPNMTALVAMVCIPLAVGLWRTHKRRVNIVWTVAACVTLYMSGSRTSFYSLVIVGAVALIMTRASRRRSIFGAGAILSVGVGLIVLLSYSSAVAESSFGRVLGSGESTGSTVLNSRGEAWEGALLIILDSPAVGVGYGGAQTAMTALYGLGASEFDGGSVHNAYLQWIVDVGLVGVPAIAAMIILFIVLLFRRPLDPMGPFLSWTVGTGLSANMAESALFGLGAPYAWVFWLAVVAAAVGVSHGGVPQASVDDLKPETVL